ncbi:hypothetical protein [Parvularcula maris]|uniref:Uncharacterized protein n=1 Tax=Parvularcula maris TaxID=2965077 RepID=A0A9X2RIT5_9PROT|nr:hypothetical protein [Parvularcula maris]MCQ8186435.1 hypothetical protein [Parvularcula maris]
MLELLTKRRLAAEERLAELKGRIAAAVADGDDRTLKALRAERRELRDEAEDLDHGAELQRSRDADAAAEAERTRQAEARAVAKEGAEALTVVARNLDAAFVELEEAFLAFREQGMELAQELRHAGLHDGNRIVRSLTPNLRWAAYRSAPHFAHAAELPRAPAHRRRTMEELTGTMLPAIEGEAQ